MRAPRLLALGLVLLGCGDDDPVPAPAEPTLAATGHQRCLPVALVGAEVRDAPRLTSEMDHEEVSATYVVGDGIVRAFAVLYREAAAVEERETEATLLRGCAQRPECERRTILGESARTVSLPGLGQESTVLFAEPGIRLSVVAAPGRSAPFAELIDLDCLRALHAERVRGD